MFQLIFPFNNLYPKYVQIYAQLKSMIENKTITTNEKLPSIRTLADTLNVSRNTTLQAYELLLAEGYIRSEYKKGYFVNEIEPLFIHTKMKRVTTRKILQNVDVIDFKLGAVDQHSFPLIKWRQISNAILDQSESYTYGEVFGEKSLRKELSCYLLQARGVDIESENIIIGSSTQQLLMQLSTILKKDFSKILLEDPGYKGVQEVFNLQGFQIDSLNVTKEGLAVDSLINKDDSLLYVTPSHQYPFGTALSIQQRWKLIKWVQANKGYIIEDDYDSEYRYGQKIFPALASLDSSRIIYFGTFSKSFLPGVRLAYMILPTSLSSTYQLAFKDFEGTASLLHQLTMAEFMRSGEWERHIKRMRKVYHKKINYLLEKLKESFPQNITYIGTNAGLYIMICVQSIYSEDSLIELAYREKVKIYPCSNLYINNKPTEVNLLLGFANLQLHQIEEGVLRLKKAWAFL